MLFILSEKPYRYWKVHEYKGVFTIHKGSALIIIIFWF